MLGNVENEFESLGDGTILLAKDNKRTAPERWANLGHLAGDFGWLYPNAALILATTARVSVS